jgi:SAM-dependent methyltransferase
MSGNNEEQIQYWNAKAGATWVEQQAHLDKLLSPISEAGMKAAQFTNAESALDIGCGCGDTSIELARCGGNVVGVDISAPMLAHARSRAESIHNLTFYETDAATIDFNDQYDLLFSRFGVMFFSAPEAAFKSLRRALKPTGRMVFICWQPPSENPWMSLAGKAVQPFLPAPVAPPNPRAPGPFAFADPAYILQTLNNAGFVDVQIGSFQTKVHIAENLEDAIYFQTQIGPAANAVAVLKGKERQSALNAVRQIYRPHITDDGLNLGAAVWIVSARNQI